MTYSVVKIVLATINTLGHIHLLFRKRTNDSMSANTALNFHKNSLWQSLLFPRTKCLFSSRHEISSRGRHTLKRCHIQEHLALKTQCSMGPESKQTLHPHRTGLLCLNTCKDGVVATSQWRNQDFFFRGGGSTNSVEDRGQRWRGSGGCSPLVRGSGDSCNLVQ